MILSFLDRLRLWDGAIALSFLKFLEAKQKDEQRQQAIDGNESYQMRRSNGFNIVIER